MDKQEIIRQLQQRHLAFTTYVCSLNENDFMFSLNNEKWAAGQQLEHIYLAVKPLSDGILLPKFVLGLVFGKSNRPSNSYDGIVEKYQAVLANGGKAGKSFIPKSVAFAEKENIKSKLQKKLDRLCAYLNKYTEEELDHQVIPHPLLGKLTMREMMYFTIYHVQHHHKITQANLGTT